MTNYEKILKVVDENGGYITTKQVNLLSIDRKFLSNLVKSGKLNKFSRGYYGASYYFEDEYYMIQSKCKNAVFSLGTALYFHDLSDRTPLVFHLAVPYGYNGALTKIKDVILNYVSEDLLEIGVTTIESPFGMKIRVYDIDKTICDIIKYRKKMDGEILAKALQEYVQRKEKNFNKQAKYATLMRIENKVAEYMEILL